MCDAWLLYQWLYSIKITSSWVRKQFSRYMYLETPTHQFPKNKTHQTKPFHIPTFFLNPPCMQEWLKSFEPGYAESCTRCQKLRRPHQKVHLKPATFNSGSCSKWTQSPFSVLFPCVTDTNTSLSFKAQASSHAGPKSCGSCAEVLGFNTSNSMLPKHNWPLVL